jgi:hypothetical protein
MVPYIVGMAAAYGVSLFARTVGLDRDRAFYPTVLIVIASYYVLFAAMAGSTRALLIESVMMAGFVAAAVVGFKRSAWITVVALAAHGLLDVIHGTILENSGVPTWWPAFCLAYDLTAAVCLGWISRSLGSLQRSPIRRSSG